MITRKVTEYDKRVSYQDNDAVVNVDHVKIMRYKNLRSVILEAYQDREGNHHTDMRLIVEWSDRYGQHDKHYSIPLAGCEIDLQYSDQPDIHNRVAASTHQWVYPGSYSGVHNRYHASESILSILRSIRAGDKLYAIFQGSDGNGYLEGAVCNNNVCINERLYQDTVYLVVERAGKQAVHLWNVGVCANNTARTIRYQW